LKNSTPLSTTLQNFTTLFFKTKLHTIVYNFTCLNFFQTTYKTLHKKAKLQTPNTKLHETLYNFTKTFTKTPEVYKTSPNSTKQVNNTLHNSTQLYKTVHKTLQNKTIKQVYTTLQNIFYKTLQKLYNIIHKKLYKQCTHFFRKKSLFFFFTKRYTSLQNSTQLYNM